MRTFTTIGLLIILTACNQKDRQTDTWAETVGQNEHTTETARSIYGQWTIQEIIDTPIYKMNRIDLNILVKYTEMLCSLFDTDNKKIE